MSYGDHLLQCSILFYFVFGKYNILHPKLLVVFDLSRYTLFDLHLDIYLCLDT
jgi:hypothetical protein